MVQYLVKSPRHLTQYLACNLLNRGYHFVSTAWIPEGTDLGMVDAKLLFAYDAHLSKERQYRRHKAGHAKVRYLRCGQLIVLCATKGRSPFFEREAWFDVRDKALHVAGYALRADRQTGKVSVRLHKEAQRHLRRQFLERAAWDVRWWEERIRAFPFLSFAGVRDGLFALIKDLNASRKLLRKPPIDWRRCVKKTFTPEPVFLDTPKEIAELVEWERKYGDR